MGEEESAYKGCLDYAPVHARFLTHIPRDPRCITFVGDRFCERIGKREYLKGIQEGSGFPEGYLKKLKREVSGIIEHTNLCYFPANLAKVAPPARKVGIPDGESIEDRSSTSRKGRALSFMEADERVFEGDRSFLRLSAYNAEGPAAQLYGGDSSLHGPEGPSTIPVTIRYKKPTSKDPFGKIMEIRTTENDHDISRGQNHEYFQLVPCQADNILQKVIDDLKFPKSSFKRVKSA